MSIELIADGIIDLIKKNIIAKIDILSDVSIGDTIINVDNSYRFHDGEEIVLIDFGYNQSGHIHYKKFEYAKIESVDSTTSITLQDPTESSWLLSDSAFIQKTIGHSPLYDDNVLYGDREVIPVDDIAITIEPVSLGNEWIYLQGGLSEEYRVRIMIYGKSIQTDEGRRILDRYSWSVYSLLNRNLHIDVNNIETPLLNDFVSGGSAVVIEDTAANRKAFVVDASSDAPAQYSMQDNQGASCWYFRIIGRVIGGGLIHLTLDGAITGNFYLSEYAVLRKIGEYFYDSRVDSINYGQVSKSSAFLRAAELSWFGKKTNRHTFPQTSDGVDDFDQIPEGSSSSSSSSSVDSSSSSSFGESSSSSSMSYSSSSSSN